MRLGTRIYVLEKMDRDLNLLIILRCVSYCIGTLKPSLSLDLLQEIIVIHSSRS